MTKWRSLIAQSILIWSTKMKLKNINTVIFLLMMRSFRYRKSIQNVYPLTLLNFETKLNVEKAFFDIRMVKISVVQKRHTTCYIKVFLI